MFQPQDCIPEIETTNEQNILALKKVFLIGCIRWEGVTFFFDF